MPLAVYRKIESEDFYGIDDLNEQSIKFSILSTALADERIGYFVGVDINKDGEVIHQIQLLILHHLKMSPLKS
jgi:hypothetical protein